MTISPAARLAAVPAVALALLAVDLPTASARPAAPTQPTAVRTVRGADAVVAPVAGRLVVSGSGFGHGRGMSQWGAYGAAAAGLPWTRILDFYYPGAAATKQANSEMRIWVSRDGDGITEVPAQAGLRAVVGRRHYVLPADSAHTAWRAFRSGDRVALQYRDARGAWRARGIPATKDLVFTTGGDTVAVRLPSGRLEEYPGRVMALTEGGRTITVVATTMEGYLRGVVPNEMPASWHRQALAAQSVAARTYASAYRARKRAAGVAWDICDTTSCQVYRGTASSRASGDGRVVLDDARADAAIALTSGVVLKTPGNNYVFTEFSASNGGQTVDGGAFAQVAKADPYDGRMGNPSTSWTRTVDAATLERTFGLGTLTSAQVVGRDGLGPFGGRVRSVRLVGTSRTVDVSGDRMRQVLGLRSSLFVLSAPDGTTRPDAAGTRR